MTRASTSHKRISVRVPKSLEQAFAKAARQEERTFSQELRHAMRRHLESRPSDAPDRAPK